MSNEIQPTKKTQLQVVKDSLLSKGALQLFKDNLPNATGKHTEEAAQRFAKMTYTAICQNPSLQQCSVSSIVKAASISASLDLDIDTRGLAYLVPYKNKGILEAQFQIGYMGLIELAYRSGKVKAISAHCIYESEKKTVKINRIDGQFSVEHPFSYTPPTGKMIAVYATAEIDGLGSQTTVLRIDEVEKFRKISKAPNSPAWTSHYEAMAKKTAIRQLAKFLPKSILEDFSRGAAIDEKETFVDAEAAASEHIDQQAGSQPIDTTFEEEETPADTKQTEQPQEPETAKAPSQPLAYLCQKCDTEFDKLVKGGCPKCGEKKNYVKQKPEFFKD
jgi:recombination protein RecT